MLVYTGAENITLYLSSDVCALSPLTPAKLEALWAISNHLQNKCYQRGVHHLHCSSLLVRDLARIHEYGEDNLSVAHGADSAYGYKKFTEYGRY